MDQYFERIQQLLSRSDFPVRIKFMIEDVIDLRNAKVPVDFKLIISANAVMVDARQTHSTAHFSNMQTIK